MQKFRTKISTIRSIIYALFWLLFALISAKYGFQSQALNINCTMRISNPRFFKEADVKSLTTWTWSALLSNNKNMFLRKLILLSYIRQASSEQTGMNRVTYKVNINGLPIFATPTTNLMKQGNPDKLGGSPLNFADLELACRIAAESKRLYHKL